MSNYTAAIIGCGDMSVHHAAAYKEAGVSVVAGADISQDALDRFRQCTGVKTSYSDYREMLDEVQPDIASIVTPHELHCPMVMAVAKRQVKGIVCEKPMSMDLTEADRMVEACRASGSKLVVNHQRYYEEPYVCAREAIAKGAIGTVQSAEAHNTSSSVHGDATHVIHMLLALLGNPRPTRLLAQVHRPCIAGWQAENGGGAFIAFDNDVHAHLTWGLASRQPRVFLHPGRQHLYYQSLVIHGDTGRLEVGSDGPKDEPGYLKIHCGVELREFRYPGANTAYSKIGTHRVSIVRVIKDLLRSIETGARHPLDGRSGRNVMEVIVGIYESARRQEVVTFPLSSESSQGSGECQDR